MEPVKKQKKPIDSTRSTRYSFPVTNTTTTLPIMSNTYEVTIQFSKKDDNNFSFEVQAKGIRWAIENACKEMKEAYPCFVEGADFSIVEIKLKK